MTLREWFSRKDWSQRAIDSGYARIGPRYTEAAQTDANEFIRQMIEDGVEEELELVRGEREEDKGFWIIRVREVRTFVEWARKEGFLVVGGAIIRSAKLGAEQTAQEASEAGWAVEVVQDSRPHHGWLVREVNQTAPEGSQGEAMAAQNVNEMWVEDLTIGSFSFREKLVGQTVKVPACNGGFDEFVVRKVLAAGDGNWYLYDTDTNVYKTYLRPSTRFAVKLAVDADPQVTITVTVPESMVKSAIEGAKRGNNNTFGPLSLLGLVVAGSAPESLRRLV